MACLERSRFNQNWGDRIVLIVKTWCGQTLVDPVPDKKKCKACSKARKKGYT